MRDHQHVSPRDGVAGDPAGRSTALVFGATGTQGGAVARHLLARGYRVRAAARHPEAAGALTAHGATPVRLDLADPSSVAAAAAGADVAFVHLPITFGAPGDADRARAAVDALVAAGVRRIVFSTSGPAPDEAVGVPYVDDKVAVLRHVLGTGGGTVLKPTGFMENFAAPWSAPRVLAGELAYPLPPGAGVAWVTNDDVARYAESAFRTDAVRGRSFAVAGPEVLDGPAAAERLGRALGRPVGYRQVSGAEYAAMLAPHVGGRRGCHDRRLLRRGAPGAQPDDGARPAAGRRGARRGPDGARGVGARA
jgi:uncharacterized protein YbjT (DUF2867 family)